MGDNSTIPSSSSSSGLDSSLPPDFSEPCSWPTNATDVLLNLTLSSCANATSTTQPPSAPAPQCKQQEYYSFNYAVVGTLFQSIIFVVGVLGNLLVCTVVRRTRSMHSTTNCYLVSLACADTITLVSSVPQEVLSYHILGDQWVWGSVGCTTMIYLQYLGIDASALSLTAFTIERYIAICHPMKSKSICTISRAKKIIAGCWLFAIVYCSPWFILTKIRTVCVQGVGEVETCSFRLKRNSTEYLIMFFCDLLLFYVIPLLLSMVLYALIARMLLTNSRNKFPGSSATSGGGGGTLSNGSSGGAGGGHTMSVSEAAAKSNQARVQVVKMLACVVVIFATLWVPYRGLLVYNSFATMNNLPPYLDLWYLMFAKTCIFMNCAINPILYNAMSDKFRKAFRREVSCGFVQSQDSVHIQRYRFQTTQHSRAASERGLSSCGRDRGAIGGGPASAASTTAGSATAASAYRSTLSPSAATFSASSPGGGGGGGGTRSTPSPSPSTTLATETTTTVTSSATAPPPTAVVTRAIRRSLKRLSSAPTPASVAAAAEQHPLSRHRLNRPPAQQQQQQQMPLAAILRSSIKKKACSSASDSSVVVSSSIVRAAANPPSLAAATAVETLEPDLHVSLSAARRTPSAPLSSLASSSSPDDASDKPILPQQQHESNNKNGASSTGVTAVQIEATAAAAEEDVDEEGQKCDETFL